MPRHQAPKGTRDLWPEDCARFRRVEDAAREVARLYGYREIRTPSFEDLALFSRAVGETTDIVEKEMWTVSAQGSKGAFALRPENTAGVVRAYLQKKLHKSAPFQIQKLWYLGPQFRHERKQKGRWREFTQFGVENIGGREDPFLDAEVIRLGVEILERVGLKNVITRVNYIGRPDERMRFRKAFRSFLEPKLHALCGDCQRRFDLNVLRLLDCKKEKCRAEMKNAPKLGDFHDSTALSVFKITLNQLSDLRIERDENLVRGLDYYTGAVFEYYVEGQEGQQDALSGGGRYDGLVEMLGGPPTAAVGLALGIDRIADLVEAEVEKPQAIVLSDDPSTAATYAHAIRVSGTSAIFVSGGQSFSRLMKQANRSGASLAIIAGEDERAAGEISLKDMDSGEQIRIRLDQMENEIKHQLEKKKGPA